MGSWDDLFYHPTFFILGFDNKWQKNARAQWQSLKLKLKMYDGPHLYASGIKTYIKFNSILDKASVNGYNSIDGFETP
jgi:hypothetical protein